MRIITFNANGIRSAARKNFFGVITPALTDRVRGASIYTGEQFSDHAPLTMEYDIALKGRG